MENNKLSLKNISANLLVYGTTHAIVDGICAAIVYSIIKKEIFDPTTILILVILYNILAFGLQTFIGLIADYFQKSRSIALLGCILTGFSAISFSFIPIIAIIACGMGNALFHIGGGVISLNLTPRRATAPGIYVAPGALGILAGALLAKNGQFSGVVATIILAIFCILIFVIKKPEINYRREEKKTGGVRNLELIIILILLSIAIRALVGSLLVLPWKINVNLLIILTIAVFLGKALGGILGDKFGWARIAIGSLLASIPCLIFGTHIPFIAIIGMFLFNITMPITLVAISNMLSGRPGFAFGLTCLALMFGSLAVFSGFKQLLGGPLFILITIVISSLALYIGLHSYAKIYKKVN